MFLVSAAIDATARLLGPRVEHRLHIRRIARYQNGEPEWYLLADLVDRSRAAADVGANVGDYSGRLAQLCPRVHAFEPVPWLADNLARKLPRNVTVHRVALSDRAGEAELRIPYRGDAQEHMCATLEAGNRLGEAKNVEVVTCEVARLDDVLMEPVGFIKIDVEGHELAVLRGATRVLREHRPTLVVESVRKNNPSAPHSVLQFMRNEGYSVWRVVDLKLQVFDGDTGDDEMPDNFVFRAGT